MKPRRKLILIFISFLLLSCSKKTAITDNSNSNTATINTSTSSSSTSSSNTSSSSTSSSSTSSSSTSSSNDSSTSETNYDINTLYDGYYKNLSSWSNGEDLKKQLQKIVTNGLVPVKYNGNWTVNQNADRSLTNFDNVELVYSPMEQPKDYTYNTSAGRNDGWQREHAFCQSLMGSYVNKKDTAKIPIGSDYRVTSIATNSNNAFTITVNGTMQASHYHMIETSFYNVKYDEASKTITATTKGSNPSQTITGEDINNITFQDNNLQIGTINCGTIQTLHATYKAEDKGIPSDFHNLFASYNSGNGARNNNNLGMVEGSTQGKEYKLGDNVFEPGDIDKGKLARAILYMETAYDRLHIQEELATVYQVVASQQGYIGNASTLIDWASKFNVDYSEYQHNVEVQKIQKNRNPYVDFEGLVDYVYGNKKNSPGKIEDLISSASFYSLKMNNPEYLNLAIEMPKYTYKVGESYTLEDVKNIYQLNTDLSTNLLTDRSSIKYSISGIDNIESYTFLPSDEGKTFKVTLSDDKTEVNYNISIEKKDESGSGGETPSIDSFDYKHSFAVNGVVDGSVISKITASVPFPITLNGIDFIITIESGKNGNKNNTKGIAFGSSKNPVNKMTIESVNPISINDKNKITNVVIESSTIKDASIPLKVFVGDTQIGETKNINDTNTAYSFENADGLSGKLRIEWDPADSTVYLMSIAINVK